MSDPATRVILITGVGRGLGRALALHLAAPHTRLLLHHHHSAAGAEAVAEQARAQGAAAMLLAADLADVAARARMMERVAATEERLHLLINNAGLFEPTPLDGIDPGQWQRVFDATCSAVQHLIHAATPLLRRGAPARVINIGDSGSDRLTARATATHYHVAKLGVHMLTRSYAQVLGPHGITVNQVSPGFLAESLGDLDSPVPLGRKGSFDDVLNAVDFLLSPRSEYVTGANIVVSGGWNL